MEYTHKTKLCIVFYYTVSYCVGSAKTALLLPGEIPKRTIQMLDSVHTVDNLSDQTGHAIWQNVVFLLHEKKHPSFGWLCIANTRKRWEQTVVYQIYCVWAILLGFFVLYVDVQRLCESSLWWNDDQQSKKVRKQVPRLCVKSKTIYICKDAITAKTD